MNSSTPPIAVLAELFNSFATPKKEHLPMETQTQISPKSNPVEHSRKMIALLRGALGSGYLDGEEIEFLTPIALDYARRYPAEFEKAMRSSWEDMIDGEIEECLE